MSNNEPERVQILLEAAEIIVGERQDDYGTPEENFTRIAELWNAQFKHLFKEGKSFEPRNVAEAMILLKIARTVASPTRDTYKDVAGYTGISAELAQPVKEVSN